MNEVNDRYILLTALYALQAANNVIKLDPYHKDAYDKRCGCLDLSKAGELGQIEAYELIREYCQ